jgi:hypothetical protein
LTSHIIPQRRVRRVTDPEQLALLEGFRQLDRISQHELLAVIACFVMRRRNADTWDAHAARSDEAESEAFDRTLEELRQRFMARHGRTI